MQLPNISELLATSDAHSISKGMATLLAARSEGTESSVFQARAVGLMEMVTPALVWMRDHRGIEPTVEVLRSTLQLHTMWMLAARQVFCLPQGKDGQAVEILVNDMPHAVVLPIRNYLEELPGLDLTDAEHGQGFGTAGEHHAYALMHYTSIFGELLPPKNVQR